MYTSNRSNQQKIVLLCCMNTQCKVINTISVDDIIWEDIKEKLIGFYKYFYLRNFFRK